jgi:exopolyphosphatase/guanosine-5'-triphosphate,3'-diphosphate pyrophosphatase
MNAYRLAVIDLGSNTFHLMIVELTGRRKWSVLLKERHYVKLASGGLERILDNSRDRAIATMQLFKEHIQLHDVNSTIAIGTSALREAENGHEVARSIEAATGIPVMIVDGSREAELIRKGIQLTVPDTDNPGLIMDIGGGSVEFILYRRDEVLFSSSYKVGVAVLYEKFHRSNPVSSEEISALENFLARELEPLLHALHRISDYDLIGASGSFEVIQDYLPKKRMGDYWSELDMKGLMAYLDEVIVLDLESRSKRAEIPPERLDYIVVAYILIRFVLKKESPKRLFYSDFALKEGVIAEVLDKYFR